MKRYLQINQSVKLFFCHFKKQKFKHINHNYICIKNIALAEK
jgi:hypothetical protein